MEEVDPNEPVTNLVEMSFKIALPLLEKFKPSINLPFESLISNQT